MKQLLKALYFAPLAFFIACDGTESAGNTTEIENAIADNSLSIRIFNEGLPAKNIAYRVLPSWYVADTAGSINDNDYSYIGNTDSSGWMHIYNHTEGSYTIQFINGDSAIVLNYTLNNVTHEVIIDSATLAATGDIHGWISLPNDSKYAWVYMQGIDRVEKTDSTGKFHFKNLPSGLLKLNAISTGSTSIIGQSAVNVRPNENVDLGHVDAPNEHFIKKSMKINPVSLISGWMRPLSEPSVLILRLDSTFNFAETAEDGNDVRLFNGNGEPLPFEIDGWDHKIQSGTINIRLDNLADTANLWTLEWGDIYEEPQIQTNVWENLPDSIVWLLNSVKIIDFESGSDSNDLPSPLPRYNWYVQANEQAKLDSTLTKATTNSLEAAPTNVPAFEKNVFHTKYTATYPDYIVFGTRMTKIPRDLSRLDSVEVWMKGDGNYEIILESFMDGGKNYKVSYKGTSQEEWERVVVRPQDFDTTDTVSYHSWDITRNKITHFTIFAYNGTNLWVDNVRLYGINRDDLR